MATVYDVAIGYIINSIKSDQEVENKYKELGQKYKEHKEEKTMARIYGKPLAKTIIRPKSVLYLVVTCASEGYPIGDPNGFVERRTEVTDENSADLLPLVTKVVDVLKKYRNKPWASEWDSENTAHDNIDFNCFWARNTNSTTDERSAENLFLIDNYDDNFMEGELLEGYEIDEFEDAYMPEGIPDDEDGGYKGVLAIISIRFEKTTISAGNIIDLF